MDPVTCPRCGEETIAGECLQHGFVLEPVAVAAGTASAPSILPAQPAAPPPVSSPPVAGPADPAPREDAADEGSLFDPVIGFARTLGPRRLAVGALALVVLLLIVSMWQGQQDITRRLDLLARRLSDTNERIDDAIRTQDALNGRLRSVEKRVGEQVDFQALAKKVLPSVFTVETGRSLGSAFVVRSSGGRSLLVTNFHVIADVGRGGRVKVRQKGTRTATGTVTRIDPRNDLAIIEVPRRYPALRLASRLPRAGTQVIVVGSPLGLGGTVTEGLISGRTQGLIQFSAPVNPGNSGGPVIDAKGQVVGVAVLKIVGLGIDGLSFAVPTSHVCALLDDC